MVAVRRATEGDRSVALTIRERWVAVALLDRQGLSAGQISTRLGVSTRLVFRQRQARREGTDRHTPGTLLS